MAPDTPPPDEAFIEFLGKDDVGDSNLMEYWNQVEQSAEQTAAPPSATASEQQARFDAFRIHYNQERPHEALDQTPPAAHWQPSQRAMPTRIDEPWYDADHEVRRVTNGCIKWRGNLIFIGDAFSGEAIGITQVAEDRHLVRFSTRDLGVINATFRFHRFAPPRPRLHCAAEPERDTRTNSE